ncbi:alpha-1,4-glucan--maltose-1-phosphate maltosyltransferase [Oerskovia jenensis]
MLVPENFTTPVPPARSTTSTAPSLVSSPAPATAPPAAAALGPVTAPPIAPAAPIGRIPVVEVSPVVEGGRWPAKAVVGEVVPVEATVFREGHDAVAATAVLVAPDGSDHSWARMVDVAPGLDRFRATLSPDAPGAWSFRVEAWSDPYGTWAHDAAIKVAAGIDVELMLAEGVALFGRITALEGLSPQDAKTLHDGAAALADPSRPSPARLAAALSPEVRDALGRTPLRDHVTPSGTYPLQVDRPLALAGAWYEMFPRSEGARRLKDGTWRSGTFTTAARRLPAIAAMGFDMVYLTPVHPIGTTHRKGRNNSLTALPGDPGSPYAIGSKDGGHDAIHPELGSERTFKAFVKEARRLGMEVALDLALQCSPDHPWVTEHPEWFTTRVDGSIAYAENPPKKYQDIYPLNFDNDPAGIYAEVLRVVRVWIARGVTAFRVDNPHTKPLPFWEWLLAEVRATNPEVIFLSEAFTKPAMMHTLARIGFHQSYTYFTWRNEKTELAEYLAEVSGPAGSYMRPSFWPTTHDILPPYLQHGGVAGFAVRAVLAALGSPTWGIYSGYELVENVPRPGVEEQIDNEKYEYKPRDWARAEEIGISTLLTRLNEVRREHPSLRQLRNLTVHPTSNDRVLAFSRHLPERVSGTGAVEPADTVIVVVNLDPWGTQESMVHLDLAALGLAPEHGQFVAHDLLAGVSYGWGEDVYVKLVPQEQVAHVIHVSTP